MSNLLKFEFLRIISNTFFFLCWVMVTSINEKRASTWEIKSQYFKEIKNKKNYFKRKKNIQISQEGHVTDKFEKVYIFHTLIF